VVGSGSNLLVADEGVRGLVLKLDDELGGISISGTRIHCGGGARLPAVAARAARAGLAGIEFGVSIPGTVGGAVRMNANAYGGDLARVLEWVDVATATGGERRMPAQLGFSYRRSALRHGGGGARAPLPPEPAFCGHWAVCPRGRCDACGLRSAPEAACCGGWGQRGRRPYSWPRLCWGPRGFGFATARWLPSVTSRSPGSPVEIRAASAL